MSEKGSGTGSLSGLTTFLLLAFIIPGVVYLASVLLLFEREVITAIVSGTELGADVTIGAVIVLGLLITSIVLPLEMLFESLIARVRSRLGCGQASNAGLSLTAIIFRAERKAPISWYFWQLSGQKIMHLNVSVGLLIIYVVYKVTEGTWTIRSWKDLTLVVVVSNLACWIFFRRWYQQAVGVLKAEAADADTPQT